MKHELKEITEAVGMMLQIGGMSHEEIIAWIDGLIEKTENPPEWMIKLSLSKGKHILDVVHILHEVPGESSLDDSFRLLLKMLDEKHPTVTIEDENLIRELCGFVHLQISKELKEHLYMLDGDLDMINEGYGSCGIIQEGYRELLDSRDNHTQPEKSI